MKKLNIVFSFVLLSFCFLINVSFAEFSLTPMSSGQIATLDSVTASNTAMAGYTYSQIRSITLNYFSNVTNSDYESLFNAMVEALKTSGYSIVIVRDSAENEYHVILSGANISVGARYVSSTDKTTVYTTRIDTSATSGNFVRPIEFYNSGSMIYSKGYTIDGSPNYVYGTYNGTLLYSSIDIKEIVYSEGPTWDGSSYFYKVGDDSDISSNYNLANIISIIKNSTEIKDNIKSYLSDEYFIVSDGTVGDEEVYEIYFYHNMINLSQFEYVYNDIFYYDLDKAFLLDENMVVNLIYWIGQNSYAKIVQDVQLFTLYYNPETGTGDIYLTSNMTLNGLKSFNSETQPIIYTTKDIAYYSATWGETDTEWTATADETKNILTAEVVDSEGNVINPSVSDTPDLTVIIGNVNFDEINKTFEENKGILNIENASWLFTANNKLIGYFIGFLSLLIVFLIISRVLGG